MASILLESLGIELHNSWGIVECHHNPLRSKFKAIVADFPNVDLEILLRCAVKETSGILGLKCIVPSYFVFCVISTVPAFNTTLQNQRDKGEALQFAKLRWQKFHLVFGISLPCAQN